jgi:hypothetical protein
MVHLGDNCIVFENFTASIGELMVANWVYLPLPSSYTNVYLLLCLVRKDMDVNEHERLSNFTLGHKFKGTCYYCCSACNGLGLWCLMPLSTILSNHKPGILNNYIRIVFVIHCMCLIFDAIWMCTMYL